MAKRIQGSSILICEIGRVHVSQGPGNRLESGVQMCRLGPIHPTRAKWESRAYDRGGGGDVRGEMSRSPGPQAPVEKRPLSSLERLPAGKLLTDGKYGKCP